jgi:hypothetical protein
MSDARKRGRKSATSGAHDAPPTPAASRQDVIDRLDKLPNKWTEAASTYGVPSQLDAVLCASGKRIARSIQSVTEDAEAAKQKLESIRLTLHAAIDRRIDALQAATSAAASVKITALESELEKLDEVLERARREHAAAQTAVTTPHDSAAHGEVAAQLDEINAMITALPVGPVEPVVFRVDFDIDSLISQISTIGTVIAPRGVLARHVEVRSLPKHARPGETLRFDLALTADYPCTAPAELEAAAASLVPHVYAVVSLMSGEVSQPLLATLAPAADGRGVNVSVSVPVSAGRDSKVVIRGISVAGQQVTQGQSLPAHAAVVMGMLVPLRLEDAANDAVCTPVISGDGTLYAPRYGSPDVLVCSADGTPLPPLPVASLGLSTGSRSAAFDDATTMLLLADSNSAASRLVAMDATSRAVRWSTGSRFIYGIAVLPTQGLVVASVLDANELGVYRLADGAFVSKVHADHPTLIACDSARATLYVNTGTQVSAFRWNGSTLVSEGVVEAAGNKGYARPLAVTPPAPGQRTSYLVVGTIRTPTLLILSLPDRRLFHTHTLEGMKVVGLAADPSGTAMAVCDAESNAIHVLPWPLPGMPPLQ